MMLERKGMFDSFSNYPDLLARWEYSSSLQKNEWIKVKITSELKSSIDAYFQKLKKIETSDDLFYDSLNNRLNRFIFIQFITSHFQYWVLCIAHYFTFN